MSIRRSRSLRAAAVGLLAALVAVPASAEAKTYAHNDPRGDMHEVSTSPWPPAPEQVSGDILRMRAWHTKSRIRVRLVFAELDPVPNSLIATNYRFFTNEGQGRGVQIIAGPRNRQGSGYMYRFSDGARVRCAMHRAFDYTQNVVVFGFSRRCISNPRWVRISASAKTDGLDQPTYADNAQRTGLEHSIHLNYSPRIRRG
ncbi:MAG: hypothetical protein ABWY19_05240 [Marmoricola sp.]